MRKQVLSALALVLVVLACAGEASALVQRTFVSGLGLDTNPCSRAEPCRTFEAAMAQTQAGGEVIALDSAGYGPVTITKAISLISPPGIYAGITTTAPLADAITVSAGPNDAVVLKGLSLTGLGVGSRGIMFLSGKTLSVEGVTISGFVSAGLFFTGSDNDLLTVADSSVRNSGAIGILVTAGSGLVRAAIDRTTVAGNIQGVFASSNTRVIVRDGVAVGNAFTGFTVFTGGVLSLENCLTSHNGDGINAEGGLARVAGTTVTENAQGLQPNPGGGGSILSRGNNTVEGNGMDGTFTGAFAAK